MLIYILSLVMLAFSQYNEQSNVKKICITVDDLPAVTYNSTDKNLKNEITYKLTEAFTKYKVPAIGFVVLGNLYKGEVVDSTNLQLIKIWLQNGLDLGNHTYSHLDYNKTSDTTFFNDITKGQTLLGSVMHNYGKDLKYFRHPYLHLGSDSSKSKSLNDFLTKNKYITSPVTIDNDDYIFAKAYATAKNNNNPILMQEIGQEYIRYMEHKLHFFEKKSSEVFNRNITQSLLIHATILNADYFDSLAVMLIKNGYHFVSQGKVFEDSAYKNQITTYNKQGLSWIFRWGLSNGMKQEITIDDIPIPPKIYQIMNK